MVIMLMIHIVSYIEGLGSGELLETVVPAADQRLLGRSARLRGGGGCG